MSKKGKSDLQKAIEQPGVSDFEAVLLPPVAKWEFKTFLLTDDCDQSPALASLGEQGWELVAVVGIGNGAVQKMFLKRQIQ